MPRRRSLPPPFGIIFSRTDVGVNRRALRSSRSPSRNTPPPAGMDRGAIPSTPAERPPLLVLTRFHATTRNAGSYTRLPRSSNWRPGSVVAHWCSFVCIACTRDCASERLGHDAPGFTSDLHARQRCCELAGPLRPVTGFPDLRDRSRLLRLLRVLRPTPVASVGNRPSRRPAGRWPGKG